MPQATAPAPKAPALDPTIVNLARAIRETETRGQKDPYTAKGGSGEFGAYQYTPATWDADVQKYTGKKVPLQQADKLLQNEVAYKKIEALKKEGHNVGQIASIWNSGSPEWEGKTGTNKYGVKYDVPQYVDSVAKAYQALKSGQTPQYQDTASTVKEPVAPPTPDQEAGDRSGAWFPSVTGDNPLVAGFKAAGNMIPSAFNFAKGAVSALNPINTLKNLGAIPEAFNAAVTANGGSVGATLKNTATSLPGEAYKATVPLAARDLIAGDLEGAQREVTNDPFGSVAPLVLGGRGVASAVDSVTAAAAKAKMAGYVENIGENTAKGEPIPTTTGTNLTGAFDKGVSKVAEVGAAPIKAAFEKVGDAVGSTVRGTLARTSGLNADTLSQVMDRPSEFTPKTISTMTRGSLGEEVSSVLKKKGEELADTGKEYAPVRANGVKVKVDPTYIDKAISETTGLKVTKGKLTSTGKASIRDGGDVRALQQVYDLWKPEFKKGYLTGEEYLNFRTDLGGMAKYGRELTKSKPLQNLASIMRGKFNTEYRGGIKGLEELDAKFGPMSKEYGSLAKEFIDPKTGELKDSAINRIANAGGKGKDALLARLEEIVPGITLKIRALKAIEDIQMVRDGHKVGTYTRGGIQTFGSGGLVGGLASGNIPLVVGSVISLLLSNPETALRIVRTYGRSRELAAAVLDKIKEYGGKVSDLPGAGAAGQVSVFGRQQQLEAAQ